MLAVKIRHHALTNLLQFTGKPRSHPMVDKQNKPCGELLQPLSQLLVAQQLKDRWAERADALLKRLEFLGQVAPGRGQEGHESEANVPATAGQITGMND